MPVVEGVVESENVADALAPRVTEEVGDDERVDDCVMDEDGEIDAVPEPDDVLVPVGVPEAVNEGVALAVSVGLEEIDPVPDPGGVPLAEPPVESVGDGVFVIDDDALKVDDALSLPEGVTEGVVAAVPVPVDVGV